MAHCPNEEGRCFYCGKMVTDKSRDTVKCLQEQLTWAEEGLAMVADELNALGCGHGKKDQRPATPSMFYPEWIRCVVAHHRKLAVAGAKRKDKRRKKKKVSP